MSVDFLAIDRSNLPASRPYSPNTAFGMHVYRRIRHTDSLYMCGSCCVQSISWFL